jgi:hypothetical protein
MRIKNNDLLPWFTDDHGTLPQGYLDHCQEFFNSLKRQASSGKLQASSLKKQLHKPGTRVKNRFNRKI